MTPTYNINLSGDDPINAADYEWTTTSVSVPSTSECSPSSLGYYIPPPPATRPWARRLDNFYEFLQNVFGDISLFFWDKQDKLRIKEHRNLDKNRENVV